MDPVTAFLVGALAGGGIGAIMAVVAVILNIKRNTP